MAKKHGGESASSTLVRHGHLRRSNSWTNALRVLATTLAVVALSGIATAGYAVWGLVDSADTVKLSTGKTDGPDAVDAGTSEIDGALTILLVGSDSRKGQKINDGEEGELNDVNLLLHVSADHKNATVVSFPRDLMLPIPSCPGPDGEENYYPAMSEQQLNSTLGEGGLPCVVLTLEQLTGMDIPYAGLITFDGVIGVSNAIGGVDVCLTQPIEDPNTDLNLPAGKNTLKGMEALQYLRTRHGVGNGGDTSRISNQQVFMSSLVRKLKTEDMLSQPLKVYALAKAGVENMTLSDNMKSVSFMQALAGTVKDIDLDRINFVQYPTLTHPFESGRLTSDTESATTLFDILKKGEPFEVVSKGEAVTDDEDSADDSGSSDASDSSDSSDSSDASDSSDSSKKKKKSDADDDTVKLPESVTGQPASDETCSQGRTVY